MILDKIKVSKNQFFIFLVTGGLSAIVNILSRVFLSIFFNFKIAILISHSIGMIIAFLLAKRYVFIDINKSNKKSFPAFALINLISVLQTFFVSMLIRNWLMLFFDDISFIELISHFCGLSTLTFTSFYGHKYITFR